MTELYDESKILKKRRQNVVLTVITAVIAASAVIYCVYSAIGVNTSNAAQKEIWAIVVSIVAGWAVITLLREISDNKHLALHYESVLSSDTEAVRGTLTVEKHRVRIGGVYAYVGNIATDDGKMVSVLIYDRLVKTVRADPAYNVFETAYGFIVKVGGGV